MERKRKKKTDSSTSADSEVPESSGGGEDDQEYVWGRRKKKRRLKHPTIGEEWGIMEDNFWKEEDNQQKTKKRKRLSTDDHAPLVEVPDRNQREDHPTTTSGNPLEECSLTARESSSPVEDPSPCNGEYGVLFAPPRATQKL
jgi:hypothetical protein